MTEDLVCWKCGASLRALPQPLGRRAACPACEAELHACRMCRHFDTGKAKQCREPMAEAVADKTRANFCEWFQPHALAHAGAGTAKVDNRGTLDALFGTAADDTAAVPPSSPADALRRLFGD
ncbi:MAG: hypothetical protein AB1831_07010 [Pseudomonadota bacterium]